VKKYTAVVGGGCWARGPQCRVHTLWEGHQFIESFGPTVAWAEITTTAGRQRGRVRRYRLDGTRWSYAGGSPHDEEGEE
jgi:hypothetical protein